MTKFESHFGIYWDYVKDVIDEHGWVYSKEVPHLLDYYFEANTGIRIEFQKSYEGEWKGSRWRPLSIKEQINSVTAEQANKQLE